MATQGAVKERTNIKLREPKKYNVIMHNDDFTTMEFVVQILVEIFNKSETEAESLMMTVHKGGKAVIGCYSYDIALSKVNAARMRAKNAGFPFKITVEEA